MIRLSEANYPWSNEGLRAFAQGPNSCTDLIVAALGLETTTFQVPVKHLIHWANDCPTRLQAAPNMPRSDLVLIKEKMGPDTICEEH